MCEFIDILPLHKWLSSGINGENANAESFRYADNKNISTIRQRALYLPGYVDTILNSRSPNDRTQNIPAIDAPIGGMSFAYCVGGVGSFTDNLGCGDASDGIDYSGSNNFAMWARWQSLTKNAEAASLIPSLIWTDFMASAVVGTKGVLGPSNNAQKNILPLPVTPTILKIRYRYYYAIPAALALFLLVVITIMALAATCFYGVGISRIRNQMRQISPGRIYTTFLFPRPGGMRMHSREWGRSVGRNEIDLSGDYPMVADHPMLRLEKYDHIYPYDSSVGDGVTSPEVLMTSSSQGHDYISDESQGDMGYRTAQIWRYHNQYENVPPRELTPDLRVDRRS